MTRKFWIKVFSNEVVKWFMSLEGNQIVLLTFVLLISCGTILFMLPFATKNGEGLSFISALFTATSASCVTGLTVVDAKNDLSMFGKLVLLLLIQAGGLGIMTFGTMLSVALGKKINLRERLVLQDSLNQDEPSGVVKLTINVFRYTLAIECFFGIILTYYFSSIQGFTFNSVCYGFFHAISAFCNAGFDLFGNYDSLVNHSGDVVLNLCIMLLIVLGSLGFTVMEEVRQRRRWSKLSLHSKIVLVANGFLILGGALLFYLFESTNAHTIGGLSGTEQALASFMQSITTRTAGFNSVDLASLRGGTITLMIALMFIGASPSSTGGGIKTTTVAVILLSTWSNLRGSKETVLFGRNIDQELVNKATTVFTLGVLWVTFAFFLLLVADGDKHPYEFILFETVSAFATVGLGIGITSDWNTWAKLILIMTMFVGRVGILTFMLSLLEQRSNRIKYPSEHIMIG